MTVSMGGGSLSSRSAFHLALLVRLLSWPIRHQGCGLSQVYCIMCHREWEIATGSGRSRSSSPVSGAAANSHSPMSSGVSVNLDKYIKGYSPVPDLIYASAMIRLLLILVVIASTAHADDLKGKPRIVDGDTIWIGPTKIRLHGRCA